MSPGCLAPGRFRLWLSGLLAVAITQPYFAWEPSFAERRRDIALKTDLPVLFGVLTCETMEQALDRAGGRVGNKGSECAEAALHMVGLLKNFAAG